jgi:Ca2+-binding EF-hand superfamily protein
LLSPFHIKSSNEEKYRFLFRLYDWDRDWKLGVTDLMKSFELLFPNDIYGRETYQYMSEEFVGKHGSGGYIKFDQWIGAIP